MTMAVPCIILAGGLGTRLRAAVADRPKCLAPIGQRSFLELQLELLTRQGIADFVLSLGFMSEMVQDEAAQLGSRYAIRCVVEQEPLGTGGAMAFAMRSLGIAEAIVTNGDTFLGGDLGALLRPLARSAGEHARMAVIRVPDRARFGGVEVRDDRVAGFEEKGREGPGAINAGFYRLHADIFAAHPAGSAFSFETAVLPGLAAAGGLGAALVDGEFTDIGVPEDYFRFCNAHAA
jgi:D-glycero-alpha-D-manno-heptose 1-phosphate guanylyltransferase